MGVIWLGVVRWVDLMGMGGWAGGWVADLGVPYGDTLRALPSFVCVVSRLGVCKRLESGIFQRSGPLLRQCRFVKYRVHLLRRRLSAVYEAAARETD